MKRSMAYGIALGFVVGLASRPALASYHVAVIDEVVTSYGGDDTVQFIEIRMLIANQDNIDTSKFGVFDATGAYVGHINIPTDVPNDGADVRWLVGSTQFATTYGAMVAPDFTFASPALPTLGGMVCFGKPVDPTDATDYDVDCLAYGTYMGSVPALAGTKTIQNGIGHSLQRGSNTNNNSVDFTCFSPSTPENNAGTSINLVATTACPATPTVTATPTATGTPTPAVTCPATPFPVCKAAPEKKSSYQISKRSDPAKRKMSWKWNNGAATTIAEIGNPVTTTHYTFCVYDGSTAAGVLVMEAAVPPGGTCDGKPCWKQTGDPATGYKYKSKSAFSYGISAIALKEGVAGKAKASLKGKSESLVLPALPIDQTPSPLRIQLINSAGSCWGASYTNPPGSDPAETEKFKDTNKIDP